MAGGPESRPSVRTKATPGSKAVAALAVAVLAAFTSGPMITAAAPAQPAAVAVWRVWLAAAALAPFGLRGALRSPALATARGRLWTALAGLALAAHFYLWIASLRLTAIAPAVTLVNAAPLPLLALEAILFGRRPQLGQWAAILVSLCGMALLGGGDWALGGTAVAGDLLALGGAAAYAAYLLAGRAVRATLGAVPYNLCVFTVAATALTLLGLLDGSHLVGFPARTWLLLALLAAVPTLVGHALANYSLEQISPTTVSLAYLLEPVGAATLGAVWLHQHPTWTQVAGGAVTMAGLALYLASGARRGGLPAPA